MGRVAPLLYISWQCLPLLSFGLLVAYALVYLLSALNLYFEVFHDSCKYVRHWGKRNPEVCQTLIGAKLVKSY